MGKRAVSYLFYNIFKLLCVVMVIISIPTHLTVDMNPEISVYGVIFNLLPFVLIALSVVFEVYFLLKKSWFFTVPLVCIAISLCALFEFGAYKPKTGTPAKQIKVMTYNVHNFEDGDFGDNLRGTASYVYTNNIDIFCLQEFKERANYPYDKIVEEFEFLPYHVEFEGRYNSFDMVIFSRYPIINTYKEKFPNSDSSILLADIDLGDGEVVRVISGHFQTTGLSSIFSAMRSNRNVKYMFGLQDTLRNNAMVRSYQIDRTLLHIDNSPYPVILCCDLNDTPKSYIHGVISERLTDSFVSSGKLFGHTYKHLMKMLRIDYVFFDEDRINILDYKDAELPYSDHNPVVVLLEVLK